MTRCGSINAFSDWIQFHPESYGTESGDVVVANFLRSAGVLPDKEVTT